MKRIYADHAATTPMLPEAIEAMQPWLQASGNPSSIHADGLRAKKAIDEAREAVSGALGCLFGEVLFTGSGTEAMNLVLIGLALGNKDPRKSRFLMSSAEHHCALHCAPMLLRLGYEVTYLPVDAEARLLPFEAPDDALAVVAMDANNELGSVQRLAHPGCLWACDIVQTFGHRPISLDCDVAVMSAHKLGGPQGVGALFVRAGTPIEPLIRGGGQERDMRAGTENVAGIVGFGTAVRAGLPSSGLAARDAFWVTLDKAPFEWVQSVTSGDVLDGHAHLRIPGVGAEAALIALDQLGVSASSGAACSSGSLEPSHVLQACGLSEAEAKEGLRFTFGWNSTEEDGAEAATRLIRVAQRILGR